MSIMEFSPATAFCNESVKLIILMDPISTTRPGAFICRFGEKQVKTRTLDRDILLAWVPAQEQPGRVSFHITDERGVRISTNCSVNFVSLDGRVAEDDGAVCDSSGSNALASSQCSEGNWDTRFMSPAQHSWETPLYHDGRHHTFSDHGPSAGRAGIALRQAAHQGAHGNPYYSYAGDHSAEIHGHGGHQPPFHPHMQLHMNQPPLSNQLPTMSDWAMHASGRMGSINPHRQKGLASSPNPGPPMPIHPSSHTRFIAETAPMRRVPTAFNFKKRTEPEAGSSFGGPVPYPGAHLAGAGGTLNPRSKKPRIDGVDSGVLLGRPTSTLRSPRLGRAESASTHSSPAMPGNGGPKRAPVDPWDLHLPNSAPVGAIDPLNSGSSSKMNGSAKEPQRRVRSFDHELCRSSKACSPLRHTQSFSMLSSSPITKWLGLECDGRTDSLHRPRVVQKPNGSHPGPARDGSTRESSGLISELTRPLSGISRLPSQAAADSESLSTDKFDWLDLHLGSFERPSQAGAN